jgi:hypothetical protein
VRRAERLLTWLYTHIMVTTKDGMNRNIGESRSLIRFVSWHQCTCDEPELQQLRVDLLCAGQRVVLVQWWLPHGCPTSQQIHTHNIQAAGGANPGCKDCTHRWSPSWRGPRRECRRARSARTYDRTESMHSNLKTAGIRSNTNRQPGGGGSVEIFGGSTFCATTQTHTAQARAGWTNCKGGPVVVPTLLRRRG